MLIRAGKISDECSQTNIICYSSDTQAIRELAASVFGKGVACVRSETRSGLVLAVGFLFFFYPLF